MAIYLRRSALQSRLKALLSTRNLSFVPGGRNCNPDLAPKVPTLEDLTSRIAEKCESLTKNGVDDKEPNTELGSHSVSVAGKVDVSKWRKLDSRKWGIQKSKISPSSWAVLNILRGEGFDTYLGGGCVDKVYDYANAMMDLKSLKLRTLVPAQLSFEEDCARILGGLRIAAPLGLSFSEETDTAIRKLSSSVTSLAKVFVSPNAGYNTSRLFSMSVDDVEANIQQGRKGFKINYDLLKISQAKPRNVKEEEEKKEFTELNNLQDSSLEVVKKALPGSILENGQDGVKKKPKQDDVTSIEVPTSRQLMADYYQKPLMNMNISHGGVCIFILGVLLSNKMKTQFTQRLPLGSELNMGNERCCLRGLDHLHGPTFHSICGNLMIYKPSLTNDRLMFEHDESLRAHLLPINFPASYKNGKLEHFLHRWMKNREHNNFWLVMFPEKRYYREAMNTTEVAIHTNLFTDLYASIGTGSSTTGGWYITIMKLPFIFLIWIGFMAASLGGLRSLLRQLRKDKLRWN